MSINHIIIYTVINAYQQQYFTNQKLIIMNVVLIMIIVGIKGITTLKSVFNVFYIQLWICETNHRLNIKIF